jgi:hypothetical protein
MAERLPRPYLQVGFNEDAALSDCLRSAYKLAQALVRLGNPVGVLVVRGEDEYVIHHEMPLDMVLAMADPELARSVGEHLQEHAQ